MLSLILAMFLGIFAGTITGLIPGIHINLIAIILLPFLIAIQNTTLAVIFISAMAITHTFIDFIPSTFLGAPNEDTALGVLPGHKFLMQGKGHEAIKLTLIGSIIAVISLIIIIPIFIFTVPKIYPTISQMMGFILIWTTILLILNEKQKIIPIIIFLLAGILGFAALNSTATQPILPLLTGLFGSSSIIYSMKNKTVIPEQKIEKLSIQKKEIIKPTLTTIIVSPICSLLPGLGSSQAAIISSMFSKQNREQFLILLGSINTLVISISFLTLFLIQKSRTGTAIAISQITQINPSTLTTVIITIVATSIICIPLTISLSKLFARNINKISYTKISLITLTILITITIIFSGIFGLLILVTSTLLGITCIELQAKKSFLMGALLIPTIIYYLP